MYLAVALILSPEEIVDPVIDVGGVETPAQRVHVTDGRSKKDDAQDPGNHDPVKLIPPEGCLPLTGQGRNAEISGHKEHDRHHECEGAQYEHVEEEALLLAIYHVPVHGMVDRVSIGGMKEDYQQDEERFQIIQEIEASGRVVSFDTWIDCCG